METFLVCADAATATKTTNVKINTRFIKYTFFICQTYPIYLNKHTDSMAHYQTRRLISFG